MSDVQALPTISCDLCVAPGTCCKSFPLSHNFDLGTTIDQLKKFLRDNKLPFVPQRRWNTWCSNGKWFEQWHFSCPKLQKNGRCSIYHQRPQLCRDYAPGADLMCVHMRGPDGKPVVPQREARSA